MSYYVLPRLNITYEFSPRVNSGLDKLQPYISSSLIHYTNEAHKLLEKQINNDPSNITLNTSIQLVHNYEFLFSPISGLDMPVSLIQPQHSLYFDIIELYQTLKIGECLCVNPYILACGRNCKSALDALLYHCEGEAHYKLLDQYNSTSNLWLLGKLTTNMEYYERFEHAEKILSSCDLIYFEENDKSFNDINDYVLYLIKAILVIIRYQSRDGCAIIKINTIYYKPIIELLYVLSSMYLKIYIMKPNSSNVMLDERYVVCKSFITCKPNVKDKLYNLYVELRKVKREVNINTILKNKLHCHFVNKIEESNVIIGQQKLDAYTQLNNLLKTKNKMEKIEMLQKHNIQRCIYWCDKHNIPFNVIPEKLNLFPSNKNTIDVEQTTNTFDDDFYSYIETYYPDLHLDEKNTEYYDEDETGVICQDRIHLLTKN